MGTRATVAMVLTDVAGSTALWRAAPEQMDAAMVRLRDLVDEVVDSQGGHLPVDQGEGDSRFAAFPSAFAAVAAALDLQARLTAEPWPTPQPLRVRIGVHVGDVISRDGNYLGESVSRCARLRDLAHPGMVLISAATEALVREQLPTGTSLRDLGDHRLPDLGRPERVFQLVHPQLPDGFPPLRSLDAGRHNLPVQLSSFVGRTDDVATVGALLDSSRLVTITGFGGVGKTRLALQVAAGFVGRVDSVMFVDLSPLRDPALVLPAIAQVFAEAADDAGALAAIAQHIGDNIALVVLDNAEQVVTAGPQLLDLLSAVPNLRLLVTSRAPLHVRGEREYTLDPLPVPDVHLDTTIEQLNAYPSVALFVERATAASPMFQVSPDTAPAIAEICSWLDGFPLAIELAAARVRLLPPKALLGRLTDRLGVLSGGPRDLPERHQTLRDTIAWSYDLLDSHEQSLFARMSVFVGGATVETVDAVCARDLDVDVLTGLGSLVDKSLLRVQDSSGESRFTMFETLREFALERLAANPDVDRTVRDRHADHYRDEIARRVVGRLTEPETVAFVERELDNYRAALAHLGNSGRVSDEAQVLADISDAVWHRGHWSELIARSVDVLERAPRPSETSYTLLDCVAVGSISRRDLDRAEEWGKQAVSEAQALGRPVLEARSWIWLGHVFQTRGNLDEAEQCVVRGLRLARDAPREAARYRLYERETVLCEGFAIHASLAVRRGQWEVAASAANRVIERAVRLADPDNLIRGHVRAGAAALGGGRVHDAVLAYGTAVALCREGGVRGNLPSLLVPLAVAQCRSGQLAAAEAAIAEAVTVANELGIAEPMADVIGAELLIDTGRLDDAEQQLRSVDADGEAGVRALLARARIAGLRGLRPTSRALASEGLTRCLGTGLAAGASSCIRAVAHATDDAAVALTLLAAAAAREAAPGPLLLRDVIDATDLEARLRDELDGAEAHSAWTSGTSLDDAALTILVQETAQEPN